MVTSTEPVLLTFLDVMMIVSGAMGLLAVPALLISRQFRAAAKTALGVFAVIGVNAALHTIASMLH